MRDCRNIDDFLRGSPPDAGARHDTVPFVGTRSDAFSKKETFDTLGG